MSEKKKVSDAVIKRLPRYYRHLSELIDSNIERISSNELASRMRITASQVRQDLNNFGGFGQQGYGYNVKLLKDEIGAILGLGNEARMNTPSTVGNNWKWRMPAGALTSEHAKKLVKLATLYGRLPEED